jgi:hypothetical protein
MLYTHWVQSIAGKIPHYDQLARERVDTTSGLSPAHYGLANQIKSVGLYETPDQRNRDEGVREFAKHSFWRL